MPSWCQIVVMVPWPGIKFVQASAAQACGVACPMARITGDTIEGGHVHLPSMAKVMPTTGPSDVLTSFWRRTASLTGLQPVMESWAHAGAKAPSRPGNPGAIGSEWRWGT
jgi:hypothetical protein